MEKRLSLVLASFLALAGTVSPVHAQATGGTLSGTVKDGTGGIVPGVTVVIVNTDTSLTRTVITDPGGRYVAADLPPGPYTVKATIEGFTSVLRSGITMSVGRRRRRRSPDEPRQTLGRGHRRGRSQDGRHRTASTGGLISTMQIEGLPLNGRSFVELANLTPGVQLDADRRAEHEHRPGRKVERERIPLHCQPLHARRHESQRSVQSGGQRVGQRPRRRGRARVPGPDEQLQCGVRPPHGRHHQRRDEVGHQLAPRLGVRVPPRRRV